MDESADHLDIVARRQRQRRPNPRVRTFRDNSRGDHCGQLHCVYVEHPSHGLYDMIRRSQQQLYNAMVILGILPLVGQSGESIV